MRKLEDIFKNRFQNKQSTEGVDTDALWAAVEGELAKKESKSLWGSKKWGVLFLFLLIGSISYYYGSKEKNTADSLLVNDVEVIATQKDFTPETAQSNIENGDIGTQNDSVNENKPSKRVKLRTELTSDEVSAFSVNNKPEADITENLTAISHQNSNTISPSFDFLTETLELIQKIDSPIFVNNNHYTSTSEQLIAAATPVNESLLRELPNQAIELLPVLQLFINSTSQNAPKWSIPPTDKRSIPKIKSNTLPLEIGIYSGINTLSTNYKNGGDNTELLNELTQTTSKNIGSFTSLSVSYLLKDQFALSSGIDYNATQVLFEQVSESDSNIWVNRLISYDLDPTTGDTINSIYGDVLMDAIAKRRVVHHNQFKSISIPLSFGMRKQFGKIGIGANLGVSYNFFLSQKGRTLNAQGDIFTFSDSHATSVPFKKSFFAFQFNPFVDINIGGHLKLRINPVVKYQANGKSSLYGFKQNSVFLGINGGLVFGF